MIAFGCAMSDPEAYRRYARPGVALAAERDSEVYAFAAVGAMSRGCNLLLEAAGRRDDLEALVLIHQDTEITDPDLCRKVRGALADEQVGALGALGANGVDGIAWWDGEVSAGAVRHAYNEFGEGELPALAWRSTTAAPAEVEALEGSLMALSPWAVRNLRFDEGLALGHGYDLDFSLRLREAGKKLLTADLRATRHIPIELIENFDLWIEAHIDFAEKWNVDAPPEGWKARARRAEAEREAARTLAYSAASHADARVAQLERELKALENSLSWRLTRPLRALNRARRARA